MLKFIALMVVFYLLFMGLVQLFQDKPSKGETYIIHEYEIVDEQEPQPDRKENHAKKETLPENVIPIHQKEP